MNCYVDAIPMVLRSPLENEWIRAWCRALIPKPIRAAYYRQSRKWQMRNICHGKGYEEQVTATIRRHLKPGMTVVDIGANIGMLTLFMAKKVGEHGRVVAFEPHERNTMFLQSNLAECQLEDRVEVVTCAVTDGSQDQVDLYFGRNRSHCEYNLAGVDMNGNTTEACGKVHAVGLDAFWQTRGRLDLVKIDVEGAEQLVLKGMKQTLERYRPTLVIEVHSPENWRSIYALRGLGYRLSQLDGKPLNTQALFPARHVLAQAA